MGYDFVAVRKDPEEEKLAEEALVAFYAACNEREAIPEDERGLFTEEEIRVNVRTGNIETPPANASQRWKDAMAKVQMAYDAMHAARTSEFRLNIFGMAKVAQVMLDLNVCRADYQRHPDWPEFDKTLTCWLVPLDTNTVRALEPNEWYSEWREEPQFRSKEYVEPGEDVVKLFEEHRAANEAVLRWRPEEPAEDYRIPVHKFGSNDGWLVTEEEAFYAGNMLKTIRDAEPERYYAVLGKAGLTEPERLRYFDEWINYLIAMSNRGGFRVY